MLSFPYTETGVEMWMNSHGIFNVREIIDQTIDEFGTELPLFKIIQNFLLSPGDIDIINEDPTHAKKVVEYTTEVELFQLEGVVQHIIELNWKKVALIAYVLKDDELSFNQFLIAAADGRHNEIAEVIFLDGVMNIVFEESDDV